MSGRFPRLRRAAALLAAALGVWAGTPAAAAGTWTPSEDDSLLLELHTGGYKLGETLRGYQTPTGVCVDFADFIQSLDLPIRLDKKSRRATGWVFSEEERFALDREAHTVQNVNMRASLDDAAVIDTPEGWCIDTKALGGWMGLTLRPDLSNLVLKLESSRKLPFLMAIERKSRAARLRPSPVDFDLSKLPHAALPYKVWRTPSVDLQVRASWQAAGQSARRPELSYEALAAGDVLGTSYEARLVSDRSALPQSLRLKLYRTDPAGQLLGPLKATHVAAGDVETPSTSLAAQSAVGRGLFVTNRPTSISSRFGVTTLRGTMPSGWDAELYRNGELIAYQPDPGTGRYEFVDVGLLYGGNDFEVVLYGPQGQVRREFSHLPVGAASIPAGQTWYWAGAVQKDVDLLDPRGGVSDPLSAWRWGVGVERGIDKRTMIGVAAQSFVLDGKRRSYLEAQLRRAVGPMLVELSGSQAFGPDGARGRALRAQALGKIGRLNVQAQRLWVNGDFGSEVVSARTLWDDTVQLHYDLRLRGTSVPLQAGLHRSRARDGTMVTEWLMRSGVTLRRVSLSAGLSHRRTTGPSALVREDGTRLDLIGNTHLGRLRVRGAAQFRLSGAVRGFERATADLDLPLGERSTLRGQFEYERTSRRGAATVAYTRRFDRFGLQGNATVDNRGNTALGLVLNMSFGPDPVGGGWRVSETRLARDGGAVATVFRDSNGDGVRQSGEEAVEGVEINAGLVHSRHKTSANGRAVVDGLRPFVPVVVRIDQGSLPDPLLQPKGPGVVVVPRPGIAAEVLLPLSPTGEVEGTLLAADGTPRAGITLELMDRHGHAAARTLSEYDGYFLFDSVPYGTYRLRLGGKDRGLDQVVTIDRDHVTVRVGHLRLEPAGAGPPITAAR